MADPAPTPTPGTPSTKRSTLTPDYQRDWPSYFDSVKDQPPRDTLLRALGAFERERSATSPDRQGGVSFHSSSPHPFAIDIACGEGRDTREMLRRGWRVLALDSDPEGVRRTLAQLDPAWRERCAVRQMIMEEIPSLLQPPPIGRGLGVRCSFASGTPHLINASFALPFCSPDAFPALWQWITRTLAPGGRFCGQFFGDRDEWACVRPKSHFTRAQALELLAPFDIEHLEEVEKDGSDAMGGTKHHHVFHVVARKR